MSKVGKKIIVVPSGTTVHWDNQSVSVKGPNGEMIQKLNLYGFTIIEKDGSLTISPPEVLNKRSRSLWGTFNAVIANMISGVNKHFDKILEFEGVGYRAEVSGNDLVLNLGFSHPVKLLIPEGLKISTTKNSISVSGCSKELVGLFAAKIRKIRKIEPFKLSGIKYKGEIVKKKAGKKLAG
ncbi:MAG: 50S ribosomal protein L6 [Candidatus Brennerbacteria bacterium RIFOXYC1_FULL_41_11]|uniref:50S ribosomal protein L6 n=1 Tax=Candidatus Brennerbacteria bacterium RIFOXYD1_FULL_41_16 TaxID=1797529 RepID=A0A1G1XJM6_9BACT|nr:MAG: 50S ribosomal protein L6 [Parcubacteria group bacterium GW2011_GWB1_41_4]OGY38772.1 MAG: 50S ribosomal protein L6 [Candidatus Brennerbacteria bacterium RIFOXYB1_FULL_41_13]OGY39055.1 MAG: 50S ribosomal protein L6 [Candidatus Brennerbacteria bacterium RIFOXYC1_FULL_41_11]OGY40208.1 MAG: 50S ribosomal protein L6 [Candidatus Brennerbacteria bacterium RIFOXYD1_FULL_41_16]